MKCRECGGLFTYEREHLCYEDKRSKDQLQDRIKVLTEALKGIEAECDSSNPTQEGIWRIAYKALKQD